MDPYYSANTASFKQQIQTISNYSGSAQQLHDQNENESLSNQINRNADFVSNQHNRSMEDINTTYQGQKLQTVIVEEEDAMTSSEQQVVEFDNPYACSQENLSVSDENYREKAPTPQLLSEQYNVSQQISEHLPNQTLSVEQPNNLNPLFGQNDAQTQSQNSPSCFHAVIAAASSNAFRSSHCSNYLQNQFDADDESEHQRDSYMRLMQSQNSQHGQKNHILQLKSSTGKDGAKYLLSKSPSEHMMSISEEQSTRKHHLKSGSLPEFQSQHQSGMIDLNQCKVSSQKSSSDREDRRSFSLQNTENNIQQEVINENQEQKNPNIFSQDGEIMDSLQQHETDRGHDTNRGNQNQLSLTEENNNRKQQDYVSSSKNYQDSLESLTTPRSSQRTPALNTPVIEENEQNQRKDKYDQTNVSHKRYFMPQAYPPVKSQPRSKSPISDSNSGIGGIDGASQAARSQLTPIVMDKMDQIQATIDAAIDQNKQNFEQKQQQSANNSDQSPSFRQQTFKPIELLKYMKADSGKSKTPERQEMAAAGQNSADSTKFKYQQEQQQPLSNPNTKSVQELHTRNNELQTRIGNLESILLARINKKEPKHSDEDSHHSSQEKHDPITHQHNKSYSHSSNHLSYINTEEGNQMLQQRNSIDDDQQQKEATVTSHRFNEEPIVGQPSHRSAQDIVKMHHLQFQNQQRGQIQQHLLQQPQQQQQQQQQILQPQHNSIRAARISQPPPLINDYVETTEGNSHLQPVSNYVMTNERSSQFNTFRETTTRSKGHEDPLMMPHAGSTIISAEGEINDKQVYETKRKMNIIDDSRTARDQEKQGMFAETDVEEELDVTQTEDNCNINNIRQQEMQISNVSHILAQNNNFMVDETLTATNPLKVHEESEWQKQDQKNSLLRFLENQNAEALRAIQHENSHFIEQYGPMDRDTSYFSVELKQTQQELKKLEGLPLSEFQTTTFHDVNDSLGDKPQFVDNDFHPQPGHDDGTDVNHCNKCQHVSDLNEALSEENERMRDHMESMILMVQQFDSERTTLIKQNNTKIDSLEQKIDLLQKDKETAHSSITRDHEETIKCLQAHVKGLERTNFQNELQSVNVNCSYSQAVSANNFTAGAQGNKHQMLQSQSQSQSAQQDEEWKSRVGLLEHELKETKDYYLKRIEALEKVQPGITVVPAQEFSDTTLLVAGESITSNDKSSTAIEITQSYNRTQESHFQSQKFDDKNCAKNIKQGDNNQLLRSQADREKLYEKLAMAEQVLEQITEELSILAAENKFLQKLNQRLTYHACRQEKYFLDYRKHSHRNSHNMRASKHSQNEMMSSLGASQSIITTKEVILNQDISKESVSKMVSEAETLLKSESRPRQYQENKSKRSNQKVIDEKQSIQESLEILEIVRVFINQNPVQFSDQIKLQQRHEKSSYLKCEQFEQVLTNIGAPVSRVEMKKLFHFIHTGMQDSSEPLQGSARRYLSIADLCKVLGQSSSRFCEEKNNKKISSERQEIVKNNTKSKQDAILRPEDLVKKQTQTIESSEVRTYGKQSIGLGDSSIIFTEAERQQIENCPTNTNKIHQKHLQLTSAFQNQDKNNDLHQSGLNALQANSIIQLEDQLRQQELLKEVTQMDKLQQQHQSRTYNGARQFKDEINTPNQNQQPTNNKVEQLKQRIERLSRQAKKSVTAQNFEQRQQQRDLNRSTSEDRATQTISNSNQYKRGARGSSKEQQTYHPTIQQQSY